MHTVRITLGSNSGKSFKQPELAIVLAAEHPQTSLVLNQRDVVDCQEAMR
jgi:7,8-dihydro-6-hydroxymethylpterin-pyrophosphokinase